MLTSRHWNQTSTQSIVVHRRQRLQAQAPVAERPVVLPPATGREFRMPDPFADALAEFDLRMGEFNRHATRVSGEMHERLLKSHQLCSESRELIARVDKLLEKDRRSWGCPGISSPVLCRQA